MMDAARTRTTAPTGAALVTLCLVWFSYPLASTAFVTRSSDAVRATTALNSLPPMIIGPMIKKMREEQAKKKMPLVNEDEARDQAEGLRVGGNSWKWPPIWPYDRDFFVPNEDVASSDSPVQGNPMLGMISGMAQPPPAPKMEKPEIDKLDPVKYWSVEKADVKTDLDEEAVTKLKEHYAFYLKDGMSVLEFGAAENSYLPDTLKLSRHVGVGLNDKLMEENPSLTEKLIVDLNKVVEDRDVDSDALRKLAAEPFDAIIMANTFDFLTNPRETFRSAWGLLKPGGRMIVAFSAKDAYADKFQRAQTRMWRNYNDDQHMWVCGSFFQFSAGEGWTDLLGFDISPPSAKNNLEDSGPLSFFKKGKDNNMYIVQATKAFQDESIDEENPEKSINSKMWMLPTMEFRDKQLVVPRLGRAYKVVKTQRQKEAIDEHISLLPKIYEALIKMDQFAFTFQMQSQLAADLVLDPDFNGNDEQIAALKEGLGLRTPKPQFWQPVGELTSAMDIYDKINLLAYLVPRFGTGKAEQEYALKAFVTGLAPTFAVIRSVCPDLSESDVQLLGTELLCAEILIPGRSTKEEFGVWLGSMTASDMKGILSRRKSLNEESNSEIAAYKEELAEQDRKRQALRKMYDEQVATARKERTMVFNPQTGKFQELERKK